MAGGGHRRQASVSTSCWEQTGVSRVWEETLFLPGGKGPLMRQPGTRVHTCACTHMRTCTDIHKHTHAYVHTCTYMCKHTWACAAGGYFPPCPFCLGHLYPAHSLAHSLRGTGLLCFWAPALLPLPVCLPHARTPWVAVESSQHGSRLPALTTPSLPHFFHAYFCFQFSE